MQDQRVEMTAARLRLLADAMGPADEVVVDLSGRLASEFWHLVARTPVAVASVGRVRSSGGRWLS